MTPVTESSRSGRHQIFDLRTGEEQSRGKHSRGARTGRSSVHRHERYAGGIPHLGCKDLRVAHTRTRALTGSSFASAIRDTNKQACILAHINGSFAAHSYLVVRQRSCGLCLAAKMHESCTMLQRCLTPQRLSCPCGVHYVQHDATMNESRPPSRQHPRQS